MIVLHPIVDVMTDVLCETDGIILCDVSEDWSIVASENKNAR